MSGLFCYVDRSRSDPMDTVRAMGRALCHLPHHTSTTTPIDTFAAAGRMRGGAFNAEAQPARGPRGELAWVAGEFYHDASRLSPADLVKSTFVEGGVEAVARLNGAFLALIWDPRARALFVVNDRFGLYPHYYAAGPSWFALAPEVSAVRIAPHLTRKPDLVAVAQYIRYQQVLGERTWLEDVRLLAPATILRVDVDSAALVTRRYWDWDRIERRAVDFRTAVHEAVGIFDRAVQARVHGFRIGLYLTGGLDARTILGFVPHDVPLTTLTFGDRRSRDVVFGRRLARVARRRHITCLLEGGAWIESHADLHAALTEGFHSWIHAHGISTLAAARAHMDVNLSGWDGGTVLGGYVVHEDPAADAYYCTVSTEAELVARLHEAFCRRVVWPGLTDDEAESLFSSPGCPGLDEAARESFAAELARTSHYPPDRRTIYFYLLQHVRRSTGNMVVFARSAIEVRTPYFDYDLVDFLYSLPQAVRTNPVFRRRVLATRAPRLTLVPQSRDLVLPHPNPLVQATSRLLIRARGRALRAVGRSLYDRPALYVDYEHLLRTELRTWGQQLVEGAIEALEGIINPDAVWSLWQRHVSGGELWTIGKIAPLMTLAKIRRRYH